MKNYQNMQKKYFYIVDDKVQNEYILAIYSSIGDLLSGFLVLYIHYSSKSQKEIRYLTKNPVQGKLEYYVDELILGPTFYRGRPLFTVGTKLDSCFVQDSVLYVGLSEDAVLQDGDSLELMQAVALFKKNIKKNFSRIKKIELFIDGNYIPD